MCQQSVKGCPAARTANLMRMAELERFQQLVQAPFDLQRGQAVRVRIQVLQDGPLDMLEHEVQFAFPSEHFQQFHDVLVLQLLCSGPRVMTHVPRASGATPRQTFRILISRSAVFRTCSFSSDSLNFLMATICPVILCRAFRTMPYVLAWHV